MSAAATAVSQRYADRLRNAKAAFASGDFKTTIHETEQQLLETPNDPQALAMLAAALKKAGNYGIAYQIAKRSAQLAPERPEPWLALGFAAQDLWLVDEAIDAYRKALQRALNDKQRTDYNNNIGSVFIAIGDFKQAEPYLRRALDLTPDDELARHNLGLCRLAARDWAEGWRYYSASVGSESRRNWKYLAPPGEPTWDGTKGKNVVIYGEQGLGDEIVAASMFNDAINDCRRVILDCDARLAPLFRRSFPRASVHGTRWVKDGLDWPAEDREIDYSISAFELGKLYRQDDSSFKATPYLVPCPDRLRMWRALFAEKKKPVIGIAWSGGTWINAAKYRTLPLADWQPIFDSIDAHWVSLQYKDAAAEIAQTPVVQYPYATLTKDYDDTAALVAALDCVITVPTAVAHLAPALGVPTIAMQSSRPCWKFSGGLAWHPGVKLIPNDGDWTQVARKTAQSVREFIKDSQR